MKKSSDKGDNDFSAPTNEGERIAKRLARAGVASRREAEAIIEAGRVAVNGRTVHSPALNVGASDDITLDGEPIAARERTRLWLFHKPSGYLTTNKDPEGRKTIFDLLPRDLPRVITVGRLDLNTEGLLILTNDGGLARQLELPTTGWLRRYRVRAHGTITQDKLDPLADGIAVDGILYGSVEAELDRQQGSNAWMTVGIREGKNREVKKVLGAIGLDVNRLIRVSYGPFQLGDLESGEVREIKSRVLRDQLGERLIEDAGCDFETPVTHLPKAKKSLETLELERRSRKKFIRKPGQVSDPDKDVFDPNKRLRPKREPKFGMRKRDGDRPFGKKPFRKDASDRPDRFKKDGEHKDRYKKDADRQDRFSKDGDTRERAKPAFKRGDRDNRSYDKKRNDRKDWDKNSAERKSYDKKPYEKRSDEGRSFENRSGEGRSFEKRSDNRRSFEKRSHNGPKSRQERPEGGRSRFDKGKSDHSSSNRKSFGKKPSGKPSEGASVRGDRPASKPFKRTPNKGKPKNADRRRPS